MTSIRTLNSAYTQAKEAIAAIQREIVGRKASLTHADCYDFEDQMNGLSGELLNLDMDLLAEIRLENASIVQTVGLLGIELALHESVLPEDRETPTQTNVVTQVGKKLYPLTIQVQKEIESKLSIETLPPDPNTSEPLVLGIDSEDEIDPLFDELDSEPVVEETLAEIQTETTPYITQSLIDLSLTAAANANGLQAGLTTFSRNPIAHLTTSTKALLIYFTENNYANLNAALSIVSSDSNLASQYKALREAIGGPDGLSGCVSQIDFFEDHTDRLSGLVLDTSSPNDQQDNDSTDEYIYVYDFSGSNTVIFSFDSRYFRSAKYMIQATAGALDRGHQATELYILHDNFHAYTREIAAMYTQDPFITYTTRLLNGRVEVLASTTAANTDFVIHGQKLRIARQAKSYGEMSQTRIIEQHELLSSYLNDGVDYVAKISGSLQKGYLVANLDREFRDMLIYMSSPVFTGLSTGSKQAGLLQMANTLMQRAEDLQTAIDTDYEEFVQARKNTEALDIAYNLSAAFQDATSKTTMNSTLNSATINAIEEG